VVVPLRTAGLRWWGGHSCAGESAEVNADELGWGHTAMNILRAQSCFLNSTSQSGTGLLGQVVDSKVRARKILQEPGLSSSARTEGSASKRAQAWQNIWNST
jgi:hypothetical protein